MTNPDEVKQKFLKDVAGHQIHVLLRHRMGH